MFPAWDIFLPDSSETSARAIQFLIRLCGFPGSPRNFFIQTSFWLPGIFLWDSLLYRPFGIRVLTFICCRWKLELGKALQYGCKYWGAVTGRGIALWIPSPACAPVSCLGSASCRLDLAWDERRVAWILPMRSVMWHGSCLKFALCRLDLCIG